MKLSEKLVTGNLFDEMEHYKAFPFLSTSNNPVLNRLLLTNYGEREIYYKFNELDLSELAEMLTLVHAEHWESLIAFKDSGINPFASTTNTITETITETGGRNANNERLGKVSAFNSDSLVTNDGDSNQLTETSEGNTTRTLTDEKADFMTAYNNLSLSEKTNIIKLVLKDVNDFLTLSIY